jgi:L-lactate dehydrogenase complex protein LldF
MRAKVAVSGANFAVVDTGAIGVVESEGNGRMCLTLPDVLITVMGIEKLVPTWADLAVFLQLLPRSSTGERMNPYTSIWTGVTPGDGPQEFHLVLLDNGRTEVLADQVGRQALHCIRCSACLNVCPVYERTGGHAYGSVYPGPIGAILTPQLVGFDAAGAPDSAGGRAVVGAGLPHAKSLPFASSLCGACYEVCPVKINIPEVLVHLRSKSVQAGRAGRRFPSPEGATMAAMAMVLSDPRKLAMAQQAGWLGSALIGRDGRIGRLPGPLAGWSDARDAPTVPRESFRRWWKRTRGAS